MTFRLVAMSLFFLAVSSTGEARENSAHVHTGMDHDHQHGQHLDSPMQVMTEHSMEHKPHSESSDAHSTEEPATKNAGPHNHNGHNQQDMTQGHGSGHTMMMYFHLTGDIPLFFEGWDLSSAKAIAGATIALLVIAALYEGLKMLRERLMTKTMQRLSQRELQGHKCKKTNCDQGPYVRLPFTDHLLQTLLHMIQILISYLLMLAVMTYNMWLLLGVVFGAGIGYFALGFYVPKNRQSSVSKMSEHCH